MATQVFERSNSLRNSEENHDRIIFVKFKENLMGSFREEDIQHKS